MSDPGANATEILWTEREHRIKRREFKIARRLKECRKALEIAARGYAGACDPPFNPDEEFINGWVESWLKQARSELKGGK